MKWLAALLAIARLIVAILKMTSDRRAKAAGRAEAIAEAANHALELIDKARAARLAATDAASDPARLRDDDGFRRD